MRRKVTKITPFTKAPANVNEAAPTTETRPLWERVTPDFGAAFMAVERVQKQLQRFTRALDAVGIPYAVIGGNAVAAWVATVDEDATRNTKDVDVLLRRADWERAANAVSAEGFLPEEVHGVPMFVEQENPTPKRAVHVIFADERVRNYEALPAPSVFASRRTSQGYLVIELAELVIMKLQAFRHHDKTHLIDLLQVGLIDATWKGHLPSELQDRFQEMLDAVEQERGHTEAGE